MIQKSTWILLFILFGASSLSAQQFSQPQHIIGHTTRTSDFTHADMDGDGDEDMLVCSVEDVRWIENEGEGRFYTDHYLSKSPLLEAASVSAVDLNGDQQLDVLVRLQFPNNRLVWYANQGEGNFGDAIEIASNSYLIEFRSCDLDGDLDEDLVLLIGNPINQVQILENDGGASFTAISTLTNAGDFMSDVTCGNLGGSGLPDIVVCSLGDDKIAFYENLGGMSFAPQMTVSTQSDYPQLIQVADINGDGDNDVVCVSYVDEELAWYENLGDGTFGDEQIVMSGLQGVLFVARDVNNDSQVDIVSMSYANDEVVELHLNTGGGVFSAPITVGPIRGFGYLDVFDLDGDDDQDIVYAGYAPGSASGNVYGINNDNNSGFLDPTQLTYTLNDNNSIQVADMDGDGWKDVLSVSSNDNTVYWSRNTGNGAFSDPIILSDSVNNVYSILAIDLDLDNDMDVLAVERGYSNLTTNNRVHVYENDGTGGFTLATMLSQYGGGGDAEYGVVSAADITGNGFPDVIINTYDLGESASFYKHENNGAMSFSGSENILINFASAQHVDINDLNGDGYLDIVFLRDESGEIFWFENDGDGTFPTMVEIDYPAGLPEYFEGFSLELVDMDGDTDLDIVVSSKGPTYPAIVEGFIYLVNDGNANFDSFISLANSEILVYDSVVADLDGDNDLDIAVLDLYGTSWIRNNGGDNYELLAIDSLSTGLILSIGNMFNRSLQLADLDNDSDLDMIYTNVQESYSMHQVKWIANGTVECDLIPSISSSIEGPSCPGVPVTLTAEGGNSFAWNNGLTNQASHEVSPNETTTYEVTISDGESCNYMVSQTIEILPLPQLLTSDTLACPGSEIALNATEGGSYIWSPAEGLDLTTTSNPVATANESIVYTVTITSAEGCLNSGTVAIEVDTPIGILTENPIVCPGEAVTLVAQEADAYLWSPEAVFDQVDSSSPTATVSEVTQIFLEATSAVGCQYEDSLTIEIYAPVEVSFANETGLCAETCIELDPLVAEPITGILWSPADGVSDVTILNPTVCPTIGTMYVMDFLDENNCSNQAAIELFLFPETIAPEITFDNTLLLSTEGNSYQWFLDGEALLDGIEQTYLPTENGNYSVQVTDDNGCVALSEDFEVISIGIEEQIQASWWQFLPTLTENQFQLTWQGEGQPKGVLRILDLSGRVILDEGDLSHKMSNEEPFIIETYQWSGGVYVLTIVEDDVATFAQKLFIR